MALKHARDITDIDLPPPVPSGGMVDLRALLAILNRRRSLVLAFGVMAAVMAMLVVSQFNRTYRATSIVMLEVEEPEKILAETPERKFKFGKDRLKNEVSVLQSSDLALRVIDRLDLEQNPRFFGSDSTIGRFQRLIAMVRPERGTDNSVAALSVLQKGLTVTPVTGSRVINITFNASDRFLAADVANGVAAQYIDDQLTAKLDARRVATEWLMARVDELRTRVETTETRIAKERAKLSHHGGQALHLTEQQVSDLNAALTKSRRDTLKLRGLYQRLKQAVDNGTDLSEITEFRNSLVLRKLRFEEGKLLGKRAEAVQLRVARQIDQQLADVRDKMRIESARIVAAFGVDLEAAEAQDHELTLKLRQLETKALDQSQQELRITQLQRDADANADLYRTFLGRLKALSDQGGLETADARLVSRAQPPNSAVAQRRGVIIAAAAVAGLMIGMLVALLLERLDNTFRSGREIEEATGLPVLASIPTIGPKVLRKDVIRNLKEYPNSALAEAIRNLRTSLLFSDKNTAPKVVMFTSTAPSEGKSTTAMLLALTARRLGKSAIIVDCDLRRPTLNALIASSNQGPGLLAVLGGIVPIENAVVQDMETGLHALMIRPEEASPDLNAADILASDAFSDVIAQLRAAYDIVILDTPPTLAVTDARIVAGNADAVIYGVRWNDTPRGAIAEGLRELQSVNAPVTGMIMTMVDDAKAAKYADDTFGSYRGRYGDTYLAS